MLTNWHNEYHKDTEEFISQLERQGWEQHCEEMYNDDDELYEMQKGMEVLVFKSASNTFFLNVWPEPIAVYILNGDAKHIVGDSEVLLSYHDGNIFFSLCKDKNIEQVIIERLVANKL